MATNTDRILSYLPHTFLTTERRTVLYTVADPFGNELLLGQNSLAEILLSHWVDFADKGAVSIDDLAEMAKLYGLAPLREEDLKTFRVEPIPVGKAAERSHTTYKDSLESVEEFREHLKHYVRTFLEGTVTVQGVLRIAAEALGLRIADEPEDLDRWWTRQRDDVVTVELRTDDAASQLRFEHTLAMGAPERPAQVTGTVDLSGGIELTGPAILRLRLDGVDQNEIDLAGGLTLPGHLSLEQIVKIINASPRPEIAKPDRGHLKLVAPQIGPLSSLEIVGGANDVAPRLLGLSPRTYHGAPATRAQLVGVSLSGGVDLSAEPFLRLEIDGSHLAEVDCAGSDPSNTSLTEIRAAINHAFQGLGFDVANDDGKNLILRSPSKGLQSTVSVQLPAAQNAATKILGVATAFKSGRNDQPARVTSTRDLRGGIDLSERANVQLRIDSGPSVTINCAGVDPARTARIEIAAAINEALKAEVADVTERSISLTSPTVGSSSAIVFETAPVDDAGPEIFGVDSLLFESSAPTKARIASHPTKIGGVNPWAQNILSLAIDGGAPIEIDLRQAAKPFPKISAVSTEDFVEGFESVTLDELVKTINQSVNANVAATDGQRLLLNSPTTGGASSLEINTLETKRRRRFVTRATVTDEATSAIFGFTDQKARGAAASAARIVGDRDLSQSVDLSKTRLLRLKIDGYPACEIDCAGPRSRATTLTELVARINSALAGVATALKDVAADDGKHLTLTSPSTGTDSLVALEAPRAALDELLGVDPGTFQGADDAPVRFVGTVDLSAGIDLDPNAALNLGFDDQGPLEISLSGPAPNHNSIFELTTKINTALKAVIGGTDGKHIVLTSPTKGAASKLVFAVPSGHDATKDIFGIAPPRSYQGDAAAPARITGLRNRSAGVDLRRMNFLNLAVDGAAARDIDCAAQAAKREAATLDEVVLSINTDLRRAGLTKKVATHDGTHLILTSPAVGDAAQLSVQAYTAGDARRVLLGDVDAIATGAPAVPASITGKATLLAPVDLGRRSFIRLTVNAGRPLDIDVAGTVPGKTFLDEIVARVNSAFPNVASATDDDHLKLTSQVAGEESQLSVLPLRYLEVSEYQPKLRYLKVTAELPPPEPLPLREVRHGDDWLVQNDGAADTEADVGIKAPQGTVGPTIVNSGIGWSVRLFTVIDVGEMARLGRGAEGQLLAEITSADGTTRPVDGSKILVGPLGSQAWVPFDGEWSLTGEVDEAPALQLNNPVAPAIVRLRAQHPDDHVSVRVIESSLADSAPLPIADGGIVRLVGRVSADNDGFRLLDKSGGPIAELRAGPNVNLKHESERVVRVIGPLHEGTPPLMIVRSIARMFDVAVNRALPGSKPEDYLCVTIGEGVADKDSLVLGINADSEKASTLVRAEELDKANILSLPRGQTTFRYLDCLGSRFNQAKFADANQEKFNDARFPDGICGERGIFDVSRFTHVPPEKINAVFSSKPISDPPVEIDFRWEIYQPGTFTVNLPADLLPRFGARFNEARFSQTKNGPELFAGAVAEPPDDPKFLTNLITDHTSHFLKAAEVVGNVPLGWTAVKMPFRKPQFLSLGKPGQAARLYLSEEGLDGFIHLEAKEEGAWGNEIAVSARQVGPAIYDVSVIYRGGCFENARTIVLGQPVAELAQALILPGPIGVLQAKAAGVKAAVTRDRAEYEQLTTTT
jgi:hypothetical protein